MLVLCSCREGFGQLGDSALKALKKEEKKIWREALKPYSVYASYGLLLSVGATRAGQRHEYQFHLFFRVFRAAPTFTQEPKCRFNNQSQIGYKASHGKPALATPIIRLLLACLCKK